MLMHWKKPSRYARRQYTRWTLQVLGTGLIAGLLIYSLSTAYMVMTRPSSAPKPLPQTAKKTAIGQVTSIKFMQGSLTTTNKTAIETTEGFYVVYGTMPFKINEPLSLEQRPTGRALCRQHPARCLPVVEEGNAPGSSR